MGGLKKQTFLQGTLILLIANAVTKVIGALFKIPLAYIIDKEGMAVFNTAYQFYVLLFIVATAGLPVAVSKMVSERLAMDDYYETKRIFRCAMTLIVALGILGACVLFFFAEPLANIVKDTATIASIKMVAPALIFVAVMAGFRGLFQGTQNMIPTALSEVVEALGKPVIGCVLAYVLVSRGIEIASAGAIAGVTAGTVAGAALMMLIYSRTRASIFHGHPAAPVNPLPVGRIYKSLIIIAVPITIGACVSSITTLIDTVMVRSRLQSILFSPEQARALFDYYQASELSTLLTQGRLGEQAARWLYGAYSGYAATLFNLPLTLIMSLSISVVPAISSAFAIKNRKEVQKITASSLRITVLFAMPCTIGLSVMAKPVLNLLYNDTTTSQMLEILAIAIVWVTLLSVSTTILQGAGRVWIPVINMGIGALVKAVSNYILIGIPSINILGASISTNICYFVIAVLNLFWVMKVTRVRLSILDFIVKPLFATAVMGAGTLVVYTLLTKYLPSPSIVTILSIAVGALLYLAVLFLVGGIKREDVVMLPKGEKLAGIMQKYKLIK